MSEKNIMRYSDDELEEFRQLINKKLETAYQDLKILTETYSNTANNDIMDTSPTFKTLEEGHGVLNKEENSQMAQRIQKYIQNLEAAIIRIENKTFGICRLTGVLIPKERLRAVPHATLSYDAKMSQTKKR